MKTQEPFQHDFGLRYLWGTHLLVNTAVKKNPQDGIKLEADHIVAYSNGGETILENLKTACWACNNGKSNETLWIKNVRHLTGFAKVAVQCSADTFVVNQSFAPFFYL